MRYSILRYGHPILSDIENLEEVKKEALRFVSPIIGSDFIEVRDSANEAVTIGYFDGERFHWTEGKSQTEAWKGCTFVTKPPLWQRRYSHLSRNFQRQEVQKLNGLCEENSKKLVRSAEITSGEVQSSVHATA